MYCDHKFSFVVSFVKEHVLVVTQISFMWLLEKQRNLMHKFATLLYQELQGIQRSGIALIDGDSIFL